MRMSIFFRQKALEISDDCHTSLNSRFSTYSLNYFILKSNTFSICLIHLINCIFKKTTSRNHTLFGF